MKLLSLKVQIEIPLAIYAYMYLEVEYGQGGTLASAHYFSTWNHLSNYPKDKAKLFSLFFSCQWTYIKIYVLLIFFFKDKWQNTLKNSILIKKITNSPRTLQGIVCGTDKLWNKEPNPHLSSEARPRRAAKWTRAETATRLFFDHRVCDSLAAQMGRSPWCSFFFSSSFYSHWALQISLEIVTITCLGGILIFPLTRWMDLGGQSFTGEYNVPTTLTLFVQQSACKMRLLSITLARTSMAKRKKNPLFSVGEQSQAKISFTHWNPSAKKHWA